MWIWFVFIYINSVIYSHGGLFDNTEEKSGKDNIYKKFNIFVEDDNELIEQDVEQDKNIRLYSHKSIYIKSYIVLFGGYYYDGKSNKGLLNNKVVFYKVIDNDDNYNMSRKELTSRSEIPSSRIYHMFASHPSGKFGILYGGKQNKIILDDMWVLLIHKEEYRFIKPKFTKYSLAPLPLYGHSYCSLTDNIYIIYGGKASKKVINNNIIILSLLYYPQHRNDEINYIFNLCYPKMSINLPPGKVYSSAVCKDNIVYIYGGEGIDAINRDLYTLEISDIPFEPEKPLPIYDTLKKINLQYLYQLLLKNDV